MKKRNVLKLFAIALIAIVCVGNLTAVAATNTLSPAGYGATASSGNYTKSGTKEPSMNVNSISNMSQDYFYCRIRRSSGTAATPVYQFTSTGSKNMYYLDGQNIDGATYFVRVQTQDDEQNTITVKLTWNP